MSAMRARRAVRRTMTDAVRRRYASRRLTDSGRNGFQTMFEKDLLAGKRILVTGGGSGLGAAMGRRFVELGAELIICGRRREVLEATAAEIRGDLGGRSRPSDAIFATGPVSIHDGCDLARCAARYSRQQCCRDVHRADRAIVVSRGRRHPRADAAWRDVLHARCRQALDRRGHRGVVLSILSTSTITGRAFTVPSAMAKSAVLAMTKSLAVEWGPKGIRTVAIAPGAFPTEGATSKLRPEGRDQNWASRNPLGRVGRYGELADLASFLVSIPPAISMARWWCRTAARICAVPAPRICWRGPTRSGRSSGWRGRENGRECGKRGEAGAGVPVRRSQLPSQ